MKQLIYLISISLFGLVNQLDGQTKMISYKSHSGSSSNFNHTLNLDLFSMPNSNFGAAPQRFIFNAQLDSLIFIDDTSTVMVTSNRCYNLDSNRSWGRSIKEIWKAGKDTVFHHIAFNRTLPDDTIREIIATQYHFANDADEIVIIDQGSDQPYSSETFVEKDKPEKKKKQRDARASKQKKRYNKTKKNRDAKKSLWKRPGCTTFILSLFLVTLGITYKRKKDWHDA